MARMRRRFALLLTLVPAVAAAGGTTYTPADIIDWKPHSFSGETDYRLVEKDGREAIHARCEDGTASGLVLEQGIDIASTPILEWEWRVDATFEGIDETRRAGDDYAARLYAVDERRIARWRTRAVNYVWASGKETGADWANAYASQARMVAVRSSADGDGGAWVTERRDLREDFRDYHDRDVETVDALAIMTDCDDTGEPVEAWYGEIRLLPE